MSKNTFENSIQTLSSIDLQKVVGGNDAEEASLQSVIDRTNRCVFNMGHKAGMGALTGGGKIGEICGALAAKEFFDGAGVTPGRFDSYPGQVSAERHNH